MNYIKHLNKVFEKFAQDHRLNASHISLYMALFQLWNYNRFPEVFHITRAELMKLSKIGAQKTYHRCLRNLNDWKYIVYIPSKNPYKGSQIKMFTLGTSNDSSGKHVGIQGGEHVVVPYINNNKQKVNSSKLAKPKNEIEVLDFFKGNEWPALEGKKFFNHYHAIGWKIGGRLDIVNWHAAAGNWMLKAGEIRSEELSKQGSTYRDNLQTTNLKDYGQPL